MPTAAIAGDETVCLEAEAAVTGQWLLEQFAPDVVAMLQEAPDAAELSRLVRLLMQGMAQVAQATYTELAHT